MRSLFLLLAVLGLSLPAFGHGGVYRGPDDGIPPNLRISGAPAAAIDRITVDSRTLGDFWMTELESRGRDGGGGFVSVRADGTAPSDGTPLARLDAAEDTSARCEAIVALGLDARPTTEVIERIRAVVKNRETDEDERKLAALALGAITGRLEEHDPRIATVLRERFDAAATETDAFRAYVLLAMGLSGDPSHLPTLNRCIDAVRGRATGKTNLMASNSIVSMTRIVERHPSMAGKIRAQLERALKSNCPETRRSTSIAVGRIGSLTTIPDTERTAFKVVAERIAERSQPIERHLGLLALGRIGAATTSDEERNRIATKLLAVFSGEPIDSGYAALALASVGQADEAVRRAAMARLHAHISAEDAKPGAVAVSVIALALLGDRRIEDPIHGWLADIESPAVLRGQGRIALKLLDGEAVNRGGLSRPITRLLRDAAFLNPMPLLAEYRRAIESD